MNHCPRCRSLKVTTGNFEGDSDRSSLTLDGIHWWKFRCKGWWGLQLRGQGLRTAHRPNVCVGCGLVWTEVFPQALSEFLQKYGTAETKQTLCR